MNLIWSSFLPLGHGNLYAFHMFSDDKMMALYLPSHKPYTVPLWDDFFYRPFYLLSLLVVMDSVPSISNASKREQAFFWHHFFSDLVWFFAPFIFFMAVIHQHYHCLVDAWLVKMPGCFSERLCWQCQWNWNRMHNVWMSSRFQCVSVCVHMMWWVSHLNESKSQHSHSRAHTHTYQ